MAEVLEESKRVNKGSGSGSQSNKSKNQNYKRYNKNKPYNKEFSKDKFKERQSRTYADRKKDEDTRYIRQDPANETIDDIKEEIVRIEKEIRLEIKEIKSMKLGL